MEVCETPYWNHKERAGGVLLYVHNKFNALAGTLQITVTPKVQSIKITLQKQYVRPIKVIVIYRSPKTSSSFEEQLEKEIEENSHNEILILGDLNIDHTSSLNNKLSSTYKKHSLKQLIKEPTRITPTSKSLLDLIITNAPNKYVKCGTINSTLSDHEMIHAVRKNTNRHKAFYVTRITRNFKNTNVQQVRETLKQAPWWCLSQMTTIDDKFQMFCEIIKIVMNKHIPNKTVRVKIITMVKK